MEMTADQRSFVNQINEVISEIQNKDDRYSVVKIEQKCFEKKGIISNAINDKLQTSIQRYRLVLERLESLKESMKDYSTIPTKDLKRQVKNLIKNKGYTQGEVSEMMGRSSGFVSSTLSQGIRTAMLDIYDFANLLREKRALDNNVVREEKTRLIKEKNPNEFESIFVTKLIVNGKEYYLKTMGSDRIEFSDSTDHAEWFDQKPQIDVDVLSGKKKVVIEFD
ncbi:hypothetical protein [Enterococcus sp. DIV0800]|uniref:hypothetical protein n=1 Tax=unclassified Enterococcus TaxID=2608891 RepID=UPI003D2FC639